MTIAGTFTPSSSGTAVSSDSRYLDSVSLGIENPDPAEDVLDHPAISLLLDVPIGKLSSSSIMALSRARESTAELFLHMGLLADALQLYVLCWKNRKGYLPLNPKVLVALAMDIYPERFTPSGDLLHLALYGEEIEFCSISHLLRIVVEMDFQARIEDQGFTTASAPLFTTAQPPFFMDYGHDIHWLIRQAINELSRTDRSLDFLVYQSACRILRKHEILPFEDGKDPRAIRKMNDEKIMEDANTMFLQLRPGPFELRNCVLENDCLNSCLLWCRLKLVEENGRLYSVASSLWLSRLSRSRELYIFCFLWEAWHTDGGPRGLSPWSRMGLKPADLIKTICNMIFIGNPMDDIWTWKALVFRVVVELDLKLVMPGQTLGVDFLGSLMALWNTEWHNRDSDKDSAKLRRELAMRLVEKCIHLSLTESPQISTEVSKDETMHEIDIGLRTTIAPSIRSSSSSWAYMRRLRDLAKEKSRLSLSSKKTLSSMMDQMSISSWRLSILSSRSQDVAIREEQVLEEVETNGGNEVRISSPTLVSTTAFEGINMAYLRDLPVGLRAEPENTIPEEKTWI